MKGGGGMRGGGGGETSIINFITLSLRCFALYYTLSNIVLLDKY
jgi:hypothetical protein